MNHNRHNLNGLAALSVASICLIAVVLSLTGGADRRAAETTKSTQHATLPEMQPEELIQAVESDRIELRQDQMEWLRGHVADLRPEPVRNQRLQEYFEVRDALELQREMSEEFNRGRNWQPRVQFYISPDNTIE